MDPSNDACTMRISFLAKAMLQSISVHPGSSPKNMMISHEYDQLDCVAKGDIHQRANGVAHLRRHTLGCKT